MTSAEQRYSQIEKEALVTTWACDRFSQDLLGSFQIETDHKPLVPLLSTKALDELPPRLLRFRLHLMRYHYHIAHVPGKSLITADTLSRAPVSFATPINTSLHNEVTAFVASISDNFPASDKLFECIHWMGGYAMIDVEVGGQ